MFALHSALCTPHSAFAVHFANSSDSPTLVSFTNSLFLGDDGWAQLAPFGDFPGRAMLRQPDGSVKTFDAIQRLDRAAAEGMTAKFKSPWHRVKRFLTGCHIYIGHPDVPAFANDYPDKTPKGMIVDLAVRDDGLYCKPVFTNEGSDLIESKTCRALSGYWSAQQIGEEKGKTIFRPDLLKSAGLTNHPNLPVHLMNESNLSSGSTRVSRGPGGVPPTGSPALEKRPGPAISNNATNVPPSPGGEGRGEGGRSTEIDSPSASNSDQINPILRKLLPWLAWHGVALAQEANADQVEAALAQLDTRLEPTPSVANAQPGRADASASEPTSSTHSPEAPPSPSSESSSFSFSSSNPSHPSHSPAHEHPARTTTSNHAANGSPSPGGEGRGEGGRTTEILSTSRSPAQTSPHSSHPSHSSPAFTNERLAHITTLLDLAIATGRITAAQRPDWTARLSVEAAFTNELEALQKLTPILKTRALTLDMGARKIEIANAADRHEAVQNLLRTELPRHDHNYDRAFAAVRKANPALFEAMQQPNLKS